MFVFHFNLGLGSPRTHGLRGTKTMVWPRLQQDPESGRRTGSSDPVPGAQVRAGVLPGPPEHTDRTSAQAPWGRWGTASTWLESSGSGAPRTPAPHVGDEGFPRGLRVHAKVQEAEAGNVLGGSPFCSLRTRGVLYATSISIFHGNMSPSLQVLGDHELKANDPPASLHVNACLTF